MDAVRVVHRLHHVVNGDAEILQLPDRHRKDCPQRQPAMVVGAPGGVNGSGKTGKAGERSRGGVGG